MRAGAEAQEGEFGMPFPAAGNFRPYEICSAENSVGIQGAEILAGVRVLTQGGDFGVSAGWRGECELQPGNFEISPEQQRERWLAGVVQRGWLQTSGPTPELGAVVPVRIESQLRAGARAFTPGVVWASGAQPQDGDETVACSGDGK